MSTSTTPHILVGADGSAPATAAVAWAADEAARRGIGLRIATVQEPMEGAYQVAITLQAARDKASQEVLEAAIAAVTSTHPDLDVDTTAVLGHPVQVLGELAAEAELLVMGSRGRGGFRGLVLGSSSLRLSASSPVPVIVLGPEITDAKGPVIAGVDGSEASDVVLDFAAEYAAGRNTSLMAVQVVSETVWYSDPNGYAAQWLEETRESLTDDLERRLSGLRERYPDVAITGQVLSGHPAEMLRDVASEASLLVVGSRGRGMASSLVLGSISHGVLHHAPCPVAVIKPASLPKAEQN